MSFAGQFKVKPLESMILNGELVSATRAGTSGAIKVMFWDENHDIMWAKGTDVPADTTSGYAKGCLFVDTDVAAGTTGLYVNVGTSTECNFDAVSDA